MRILELFLLFVAFITIILIAMSVGDGLVKTDIDNITQSNKPLLCKDYANKQYYLTNYTGSNTTGIITDNKTHFEFDYTRCKQK